MDSLSDAATEVRHAAIRPAMPRDLSSTLPYEVRGALEALKKLLGHDAALGAEACEIVRRTHDEVERRLAREGLVVLLLGKSQSGKSRLVNSVLGAPVLATANRPCTGTFVFVRKGPVCDYEARLRDGPTERFATKMPDREPLFLKSLEPAEEEQGAAAAAVFELQAKVEQASASASSTQAALAAHDLEIEQVGALKEHLGRQQAEALEAQAHLDAERAREPPPHVPRYLRKPPPWWAVWLWVLRLVMLPFWRVPLRLRAAAESKDKNARERVAATAAEVKAAEERLASLDAPRREAGERLRALGDELSLARKELSAARQRLEHANERVDRLREERAAYAKEREQAFISNLKALTDRQVRSGEVVDVRIEYPAERFPPTVTLIDTPGVGAVEELSPVRASLERDVDACVYVADLSAEGETKLVDATRTWVPHVFVADRSDVTFRGLLNLLERERVVVSGSSAAQAIVRNLPAIQEGATRADGFYASRLSALESQRIPAPPEFRARQLDRMEKAIDEGADDVIRAARTFLHDKLAAVRTEWKEAIDSASDRGEIATRAKTVNESAAARLALVLEQMSEHVASELWRVAETLETWAVEEIHARYQLARRGIEASVFAPVASSVTRDDFDELRALRPIVGPLETFERQRVVYGLGGTVAGAIVGTLAFPIVGTAIGAFVGVFAGFLKGTGSLKRDCIARLDAVLEATEKQVSGSLDGRKGDLARAIRASIDDALDQALEQLDQPIARLIAIERKAIESERTKRRELAELVLALKEAEVRLKELVALAQTRVQEPKEWPTEITRKVAL